MSSDVDQPATMVIISNFSILSEFLVIGLLFTTVPTGEYLTSPQTATYLANIAGFIHYYLPGVFESNPFPVSSTDRFGPFPRNWAAMFLSAR